MKGFHMKKMESVQPKIIMRVEISNKFRYGRNNDIYEKSYCDELLNKFSKQVRKLKHHCNDH